MLYIVSWGGGDILKKHFLLYIPGDFSPGKKKVWFSFLHKSQDYFDSRGNSGFWFIIIVSTHCPESEKMHLEDLLK